jgi:hypothetical protein
MLRSLWQQRLNVSAKCSPIYSDIAHLTRVDNATEDNHRDLTQADLGVFFSSVHKEEEPPTPTLPEVGVKNNEAQPSLHPVQDYILTNPSLQVHDGVLNIASRSGVQHSQTDGYVFTPVQV